MSNCENHQIEISALLDGECSSDELLPLIDHLSLCADCRQLYQEMRLFQNNLDATPLPESEAIAVPEKDKAKSMLRFPRAAYWATPLAATIALVIGLTQFDLPNVNVTRIDSVREDSVISIELEKNKGEMTDDRFVDLAVELLSSDQKYQQTMADVLERAWSPDWDQENSNSSDENGFRGHADHRPQDRETRS